MMCRGKITSLVKIALTRKTVSTSSGNGAAPPSELVARLRGLLLDGLGVVVSESQPGMTKAFKNRLWLQSGITATSMIMRHCGVSSRFLIESAIVHAAATRAANPHAIPSLGLMLVLDTVADDIPVGVLALLKGANLPEVDLILVAARGRSWAHLPAFGIPDRWFGNPTDNNQPGPRDAGLRNVFTPASLWFLKAIIYGGLKYPEKLWGGPSRTWTSATELAMAHACSVATVTRALQAMSQKGWIAWDRGWPIRCVQPEVAIQAWINYGRLSSRRSSTMCVAPVFNAPPPGTPGAALDWLARKSEEESPREASRWAISGWFAAEHRGMRAIADLSTKRVSVVTDGATSLLMDRWKLIATDPRDALFTLEATTDISRLNAAAEVIGEVGEAGVVKEGTTHPSRLRWEDPIQAAIDIARDRLQGPAQASAIAQCIASDLVQ